jgi:hypothetical protein
MGYGERRKHRSYMCLRLSTSRCQVSLGSPNGYVHTCERAARLGHLVTGPSDSEILLTSVCPMSLVEVSSTFTAGARSSSHPLTDHFFFVGDTL